jgi:hypothetical protein
VPKRLEPLSLDDEPLLFCEGVAKKHRGQTGTASASSDRTHS